MLFERGEILSQRASSIYCLENKGYNDIFIPNLMVLSPTYAEYKKALDNLNDRMCRELGLYYDSNYNLVIKKDNSK